MKKWNCGSEDKMIWNMFYCLTFLDFLGGGYIHGVLVEKES